MMSYITTSKTK